MAMGNLTDAALKATLAVRAVGLLDLTSLNEDDDEAAIERLCRRALTPVGAVAAVCIWPRFVPLAKRLLAGTGVRVATVVNFPYAEEPDSVVVDQLNHLPGYEEADEIDLVLKWGLWLPGPDGQFDQEARQEECELIRAIKRWWPQRPLKIILETGALGTARTIVAAGRDAIAAGADFLKTSTGKGHPGASPEAARALIALIREERDGGGRTVGFKAAGGIRTLADAGRYIAIADEMMGPGWATAAHFRLGASTLLDDLLSTLGHGGGGDDRGGY